MMGSGKTTVGRIVAQQTGWPYYDNDDLLALLHRTTARDLLAEDGVRELRETEAEVLRAALDQEPPAIVGAPAGTILDDDARRELKRKATVVWLTAAPATLARRAKGSRHRPWLGGDAQAWMTATLAERAPLYESVADMKISTERRGPIAIATEIVAWLERRCSSADESH